MDGEKLEKKERDFWENEKGTRERESGGAPRQRRDVYKFYFIHFTNTPSLNINELHSLFSISSKNTHPHLNKYNVIFNIHAL